MHKIHLLFHTLSLNVLDAQYLPQIMHGYFNSESSPKLVPTLTYRKSPHVGSWCKVSFVTILLQGSV